jgi:hypothetical protein
MNLPAPPAEKGVQVPEVTPTRKGREEANTVVFLIGRCEEVTYAQKDRWQTRSPLYVLRESCKTSATGYKNVSRGWKCI